MKTVRSRSVLQNEVALAQAAGKSIHFVPTMGALHAGHLSLVRAAQHPNSLVVVSIFVNPTQFNQAEDLAKYPRQEAADLAALAAFPDTLVFLPSLETIYAAGTSDLETYDLGPLENLWEGRYRPGHFQGVCQVVSRLLLLVQPHLLFLGQKDFQQCLVLEKMMSKHFPTIRLVRVPTQRAPSGLALSSRNQRLSPVGVEKAAQLYQSLKKMEISPMEVEAWQAQETQRLLDLGFDRIDYLVLADAETLEPLRQRDPARQEVILAAAYLEGIRLIDNLRLTGKA